MQRLFFIGCIFYNPTFFDNLMPFFRIFKNPPNLKASAILFNFCYFLYTDICPDNARQPVIWVVIPVSNIRKEWQMDDHVSKKYNETILKLQIRRCTNVKETCPAKH